MRERHIESRAPPWVEQVSGVAGPPRVFDAEVGMTRVKSLAVLAIWAGVAAIVRELVR